MNLDELIKNIRSVSQEEIVQNLSDYLREWKTDDRNAIEFRESVERYLGNIWIEKEGAFKKIYKMWSEFSDVAIDGIGGMTMNERLYWFGLMDLYDNAKNNSEREKFYAKLMAKK